MKRYFRRPLPTLVGAALAAGLAVPAGAVVSRTGETATGNQTELTLWVFNVEAQKSYTRDLGIALDNFRTTSTQIPLAGPHAFNPSAPVALGAASGAGVNQIGYSLNFGADSLLTSFFTPTELASATYQVIAAKATAQYAALSTNNNGAAAVEATINSQLNQFRNIDNAISGVNLLGTHPGNLNGSGATADPDNIAYVGKSLDNNFAANAPFTTDAQVDTPLSFFQLTRNGTLAFNPVNVTEFGGDWLLTSDGMLSYTVPVPEPETYALMVAGIALVAAAVRRQRKAQ
ncbi:MAG: PEP-CTERM sorting domain-containing protein [Betaproteobacteria bacterium]|nr:PEP-CTERM sorting domain-containing protein [Betaproteobacteria bacterium]